MDIVLRAAFTFGFILFLTRIAGKRELSTLEPLDLILLVVMGDLVAQGVLQSDYSVTGIMLASGTMSLMTVLASYLSFRVKSLRPVLDGEPVVLVQDGAAIDRNLKRERITPDELAASARQQGIEAIAQVKWAVLETNGRIRCSRRRCETATSPPSSLPGLDWRIRFRAAGPSPTSPSRTSPTTRFPPTASARVPSFCFRLCHRRISPPRWAGCLTGITNTR